MKTQEHFLPFSRPSLGELEIEAVVACLRSGWLTTGPKAKQFEQEFSKFVGAKYAVAINSATAGLHLALEAFGIGPGDKIVTTPYTFTATAEVIRYLGADPLFVDIEPNYLSISASEIAKIDDENVKAVIPVHFAGQACEMDALLAIAGERGWRVIEDAAHALPATHNGRMIGTLGDVTVYSFYANKTITTGEGGMLVTDNRSVAERARQMRLHGISRDVFDRYTAKTPSWYYEVVAPGFKYNMTDLAAVIGIQQLKKADAFQRRRSWIARRYTDALQGLPLKTPQTRNESDIHSWHLYVIQLELESLRINRDEFIEYMAAAGIGTSVHFIPLHIQPYWRDRYNHSPEDFPVAYDVYRRAVSLPIYPSMSDADVERVIRAVEVVLGRYGR